MRKQYRIIGVLLFLIAITFSSGLTYSFFHSQSTLNSNNTNIAKFVFNTEELDNIELPLVDLKPGFNSEFLFSIKNSLEESISDVTLEYQLIIKTFQLVPLKINLYKVEDEESHLISTCDNTSSRDADTNEVICNTEVMTLKHSETNLDNYKITVEFPSEYNDEIYANLVDYINIEAKSWQKVGVKENEEA